MLKVIFVAPPIPEDIVIVFPTAKFEPPLLIVITGVEEPSNTTSKVAPDPEPPVPETAKYVPGVPPVPPAIESNPVILFDLHCVKAYLIVL